MISINIWFSITTAAFLLGCFILFVARVEQREFAQLPVVGKFFTKSK
jgi:hypothetical protein